MTIVAKNIDYYSKYDQNTFWSVEGVSKKIIQSDIDTSLLDAAIFWCTNLERVKYGLKPFLFHYKLREMAILHSGQMRTHSFFDHENIFDVRYKTLTDRLETVKDNKFNGFFCYAENIADYPVIKANESFTYTTKNGISYMYSLNGKEIFPFTYAEMAKYVVEGWMKSPGHRANILNPDYLYLGCGSAPYEDSKSGCSIMYFKLTQNFGGDIVAPSILGSIKQTIGAVLNPHGTESANKSKYNALFEGWRHKKSNNSMATNQGLSYNVDIVFCIDVTGSMAPVLNIVKENSLKLYPDLMEMMKEKDKWVDKLRIKVIAFRDFEADKNRALEVLDFVDLPDKQEEFRSFVSALKPEGGGPIPENGLEALAMAINSDWNKEGDKRRHIIVVYSDAPTHSLEEASAYKPEGMPATFNDLTDWWEGQGKMESAAKRLILFAPDAASWTDIATYWDNVIHYPSIAGEGLSDVEYKTILSAIVNSI